MNNNITPLTTTSPYGSLSTTIAATANTLYNIIINLPRLRSASTTADDDDDVVVLPILQSPTTSPCGSLTGGERGLAVVNVDCYIELLSTTANDCYFFPSSSTTATTSRYLITLDFALRLLLGLAVVG
eukprot:scaffold10072_cov74-Skeletonema_dohrnii-CCMP3373.AAC.1